MTTRVALGPYLYQAGLVLSLLACSNAGKHLPDRDAGPKATPAPNSDQVTADAAPKPPPKLILDLNRPEEWRNVAGYLVNEADCNTIKNLEGPGSRLGFPAVRPGVYDLIATAETQDQDGQWIKVGARVNHITVQEGRDTFVRNIDFSPLIALKGRAYLHQATVHEKIRLFIPGTGYETSSAADGSFTLAALPAGQHNIAFEYAGYRPGFLEMRLYKESSALPDITLSPDGEPAPSGIRYEGEALDPAAPARVTVQLTRPAGMNWMRSTLGPDLNIVAWMPFQSSLTLDLPQGSNQKLSVQFSRDGQQLSTIYQLSFPVTP